MSLHSKLIALPIALSSKERLQELRNGQVNGSTIKTEVQALRKYFGIDKESLRLSLIEEYVDSKECAIHQKYKRSWINPLSSIERREYAEALAQVIEDIRALKKVIAAWEGKNHIKIKDLPEFLHMFAYMPCVFNKLAANEKKLIRLENSISKFFATARGYSYTMPGSNEPDMYLLD
jgi:hypothetical protein